MSTDSKRNTVFRAHFSSAEAVCMYTYTVLNQIFPEISEKASTLRIINI